MAPPSPRQRALRRRVEQGLRVAAPALDLLLYVGDRASRLAGRNDPQPEPPRRPRSSLGGSPRQA